MIIAAALAADAGPAPAPAATPPAATTQVAAASGPEKAPPRKSRMDQVICKTVLADGTGATRQACATRREWADREYLDQQDLRLQQRGFCGNGTGC
jgi:hypothetical protein